MFVQTIPAGQGAAVYSSAVLLERSMAMEVAEILSELAQNRGYFPRGAVGEAVRRREEISPPLLDCLRDVAQRRLEPEEAQSTLLPLYAMFLLAQFRDRRAYPWVIALCRLPHESVDALLGDTITEGLPRIIASVFDGDAGPIKSIIENAAVDEFVRGSALRSLSILVHEGALARADVVAYLTDLFRDKLEQEYSHVRDVVVSEALNLHATTLAEDIRAGYEAGLIDPGYIHPTSVERGFAMNEDAALARAKRRCGGLIDDVIREMHWWACFQPGGSSRSEAQLEFQPDRPESETVMRSAPKVGRNAPCPCGSGMKYKKCCGK